MAQFVPLKIETGSDEWQQWASKYEPRGGNIPILYVVRADGTQIYGANGSKQGAELPLFLREQLLKAGTIFTDQQRAAIKSAVDDAHQAIDQGDAGTAVRRLESLRKIGTPGKLGSYATVALEADSLYAKLEEEGRAALQAAQEKLAGDNPLAGVLGIMSANRIYGSFPSLKKDLGTAERELSRDPQLKELVEQAKALDRGLALVVQKDAQTRKSGISALGLVVTRFPGTPAASLAEEKLAELGAEVPTAPPAGSAAAAGTAAIKRTWTDASGQFRVEAELLGVVDGKVQLKKPDGTMISVPLEKLSVADRQYLADH